MLKLQQERKEKEERERLEKQEKERLAQQVKCLRGLVCKRFFLENPSFWILVSWSDQ